MYYLSSSCCTFLIHLFILTFASNIANFSDFFLIFFYKENFPMLMITLNKLRNK
jgi:hypothetical protein